MCSFVADLRVFPRQAHFQAEGGLDMSQLDQCTCDIMLLFLLFHAHFK